MHNALGDALVIEVRDLLAQDEVFKKGRAAQTRLQRALIVSDRHALVGRQHATARIGAHAIERAARSVVPLGRRSVPGLRRSIGFAERACSGHGRRRLDRQASRRRDGVVMEHSSHALRRSPIIAKAIAVQIAACVY